MKREKVCLCGDGALCRGLTAGFRMLGDPRGGYAKVPKFQPRPSSLYYVERNQRRAAYLRRLLPDYPIRIETRSRYVALHHFHPRVIDEMELCQEASIPDTLTGKQMLELGIKLDERDHVIDEKGNRTGDYIFPPSYRITKAKRDLKKLLHICLVLKGREASHRSNLLPEENRRSSEWESDEEASVASYLPMQLTKKVNPWLAKSARSVC